MKLVSSGIVKTFVGGSVKRENGDGCLGIDEIIKEMTNIENFEIKTISEKECEKLVHLPVLLNLQKYEIQSLETSFNLTALSDCKYEKRDYGKAPSTYKFLSKMDST